MNSKKGCASIGMCIYWDARGLRLVALNASEARTHSGTSSKLVTSLISLSIRDVDAIDFQSVRFLFINSDRHLDDFSF